MRTEDQIRADIDATKQPFANGSEYVRWADRNCDRCANDDADAGVFCPLLTVTMLGEGWPVEWTRVDHNWTIGEQSGSYQVVGTCTEFLAR